VVAIDTDVMLLAFAYHQDKRQQANSQFLNVVQSIEPAITIYNLMEILGQLSFNLAPRQLDAWQSWLVEAYQLTVIWPLNPDDPADDFSFKNEIFTAPFARMRSFRMPFMDSLILNLAERTPNVDQLVTWNARHFQNKSTLAVLTPEEFLIQFA
jgi:hypothetical protein